MIGIVIVGFVLLIGYYIFTTNKLKDKQHQTDMENTFKIFLKRVDQIAYVYSGNIPVSHFYPEIGLVGYDTPAGELMIEYNKLDFDHGLGKCLGGTHEISCARFATRDYNGNNYFVCDIHYDIIQKELNYNIIERELSRSQAINESKSERYFEFMRD